MQEQKKTLKELRREAQGALLSKVLILENEINNLDVSDEIKSKMLFLTAGMKTLAKSYKAVLSGTASIVLCRWHNGNYAKLNNIAEHIKPEFYKIWKSQSSAQFLNI